MHISPSAPLTSPSPSSLRRFHQNRRADASDSRDFRSSKTANDDALVVLIPQPCNRQRLHLVAEGLQSLLGIERRSDDYFVDRACLSDGGPGFSQLPGAMQDDPPAFLFVVATSFLIPLLRPQSRRRFRAKLPTAVGRIHRDHLAAACL